MSARSYATKRRVAEIAAQLSQCDTDIMKVVARINLVSARQLRQIYDVETLSDQRMLRLQLQRLVELRVLSRLSRRIGGERSGSDGYVYALDVVGQRLAWPHRSTFRPPWTPQPMHLRHALAVTQLYVELRLRTSTTADLVTFEAEPTAWRIFNGSGGARLVLKPDAFVVIDGAGYQDRLFIEIDRGTESRPRITDKAKTYIRYYQSGREQDEHGVFPLVVWIAPRAARRQQLVEALSLVPAEHWRLFVVTTDDRAAQQLLNGAYAPLSNREEETT